MFPLSSGQVLQSRAGRRRLGGQAGDGSCRDTANAVCDGYDPQPGISGVRIGETVPPESHAALKEQTKK